MTLVDNPSLLELRLNAIIDMKVGNLFLPHDDVRMVSRAMIQALLRETVREAISLYREDFAVGMRKVLTIARTNAIVPSE